MNFIYLDDKKIYDKNEKKKNQLESQRQTKIYS